MAAECLRIVETVTSGATPAVDVRSLASDPAVIQPRFWTRLAAAAAVLAFILWR